MLIVRAFQHGDSPDHSISYLLECVQTGGRVKQLLQEVVEASPGCSLDDFSGGQREAIATMWGDNLNPDG